jgi:aspartyl-tRNA(Asn)/glutamyl-tRNA(Gln) amidotransferase subunit C
MNKEEVFKLAKLARIEIGDDEADRLSHEFKDILGYVGEIKSIKAQSQKLEASILPIRNVMREDSGAHESGLHTKQILTQAPAVEGDYVKVKKIL